MRTGESWSRVPRPRSTRNTIGNSSPLAACTVIRLTASTVSTTAFDMPADSRSTWSDTRAMVA